MHKISKNSLNMTGRKKTECLYLDMEDVRRIYDAFAQLATTQKEPVPNWTENLLKPSGLESELVQIQTAFFGFEQYPTLEAKAARLFYGLIKGHYFYNGNKRMALLVTTVFIRANQCELDSSELNTKTIEISESAASDYSTIKTELTQWFRARMKLIS